MTVSIIESDPFKEMEDVAGLMMKGLSEYTAARRLGMKVVEVRSLWGQYKERLDNDTQARDAARDHLNLMVRQYDDLISKAHDNLSALDTLVYDEKISGQINQTIKTISDMQAKRVDLLQKAGLLDAGDLGDELAEREEREATLLNILRVHVCSNCRPTVMREIQKLTNKVEVIRDDGDVVEGAVVEDEG